MAGRSQNSHKHPQTLYTQIRLPLQPDAAIKQIAFRSDGYHRINLYIMAFSNRLEHLVESRNKSLCQPETENELGTSHQELGSKTLEEGSHALVLGHVGDDTETRLLGLKVAVLNTGLDDIERSRDDERSRGTGNGCDKVLEPGGTVVVGQLEEVFLSSGTTTEELYHALATCFCQKRVKYTHSERTGSVTGGSPAPTSVETEALVGNDSEETATTESLRVCLTLDLENVEGENDDLTNTDQTGGC